MKNMLKEFRDFAMRGNVIDMSVGIIIGAAFGKIVDSLVKDIFTPLLGILMGKVDFSAIAFHVGSATVSIGVFLNNVISFIIVAFAIFLIIKFINSFKKKQEAEAATTKACPFCCTQIPLAAVKCPACTADLK